MSKNELEKCVMPICGEEMNILVDTPIELRANYVEGAGQLCDECHEEIYSSREILLERLYLLNDQSGIRKNE